MIIANLALKPAIEVIEIRFGRNDVDNARSRVAAVERALRTSEYLHPLHIEIFLLEEAVLDQTDVVETDGDPRVGSGRHSFGPDPPDGEVVAGEVVLREGDVW